MRFAIFGDVHSNLEALEAVLADAREQACTGYACIGDIVGYNANPQECLNAVRDLACPVVKGNHDEQASVDRAMEGFNPLAEEALAWTRQHLDAESRQWLRDLRLTRQVRDFTIVHATLDTPQRWGYVFNQLDAAASFSYQHTAVCFFGHTHSPRAFIRDGSVYSVPLEQLKIEIGKKYFLNVGSVGQPRDGDWRASYAIYDVSANTVELRRLTYDIDTTKEKILQARLPRRLAERLELGK